MNAPSKIEPASLVGVLAQALPALGAVHKNKKNPAFKSNYADLNAVLQALAPITEHGLWFRQEGRPSDKGVALETYYIHESGAELSAGITEVPVNKSDAQAYGSAQSYCRRYALLTAFGLCADDDDGNAAARGTRQESAVSPPPSSDRAARGRDNGPSKSKLDAAETQVVRELMSCGDEASLIAYLETPEYKADKALLEEFRPSALYGPPPADCPEYTPIKALVARMLAEFRGPREQTPVEAG